MRSAYRARPPARTSTGLPRSARVSSDRGGCPLDPGDGGAPPEPSGVPGRRLPLPSGQSLNPSSSNPSTGVHFTRHQRGFKQFTRPAIPLACGRPDGTGHRLGFPPSFAPRRPGAGRRTSRWGQAIEHGPGTTRSTSHGLILQSCSSLTACDLVSQRHNCAPRRSHNRSEIRSAASSGPATSKHQSRHDPAEVSAGATGVAERPKRVRWTLAACTAPLRLTAVVSPSPASLLLRTKTRRLVPAPAGRHEGCSVSSRVRA